MITVAQRWMRGLKMWIAGEKHPDTDRTIYVNVYQYDRVRRVLIARCKICDFVVSRDAEAVREISFKCKDTRCCTIFVTSKPHQVCNLCYDLFHSLYVNFKLKNMNYFKEIDEGYKKDYEDFKRRDRNP